MDPVQGASRVEDLAIVLAADGIMSMSRAARARRRSGWLRVARWTAIAFVAIPSAGCGGGASPTATVDYASVRAMGEMYGLYQQEHSGQAPKDEQAFREFLASKQEALDRLNLTVDGMFVSPRGQPLEWVYGSRPPRSPGGTFFAFEKTAVEGKRLVIGARGMYEEMDDVKFKKLFPKAS
jgi:hypothetical protein